MASFSSLLCVALFSLAHGAPKPDETAATAPVNCFHENQDYPGNDFKVGDAVFTAKDTAQECQALCAATDECKFFTYSTSNKRCYMKTAHAGNVYELGAISGPKDCKIAEALVVTTVATTTTTVKTDCYDKDKDYPGNDVVGTMTQQNSAEECQAHCAATEACKFFTWANGNKRCYLKTKKAGPTSEVGATSGPQKC